MIARMNAARFLAELKRRKVFRVAAVYGATAFVVLQGADLVFPHLGLPRWTVTLVVVLGLLGLPVALALAWAFDATSDGVRRETSATTEELAAIVAQPRSRRWPAGVAALAGIMLLAGGAWWTLVGAGTRPGTYDSIAVLPFANLSGDAADDYFGDGLAEELLNALSSIDGLKVAARTSAFAFKGTNTDVRTIGDTLRVAAVLEGSVRRTSDRLRISAQLIDARSGYRLWSETYDRPLTDMFAIQDAIAAEIVNALSVRLTGAARDEGLYRGGTTDVEAYDLYLLGRQKWATRQIPLLHEAVDHFEQAIARDSSFALAWSGFADAIDALAWRRDPDALTRVGEAKYAAQRAILVDPELAEGWASLGVLAVEFDHDWAVGELALRHAVRLKPSYAIAHDWLSDVLLYTGRADESLAARRHARELDPLSSIGEPNYAWALAVAGRWDEARTAYRKLVLSRNTNTATPLMGVTNALRLGIDVARAAELAQEWARRAGYSRPQSAKVIGEAVHRPELRDSALAVLRQMEAEGAPARELAGISLVFGEREAALRLLERAFAEGDPQLVLTAVEPTLDPLRDDPRFIEILKSLRLPAAVVQ
jgi:adenylate cyclase